MAPAHRGVERDQGRVGHPHHRLVEELQLLIVEGLAQLGESHRAILDLAGGIRRRVDPPPAASLLGGQTGDVGIAHQGDGVVPVVGEVGDPDAHLDLEGMPVDGQRFLEGGQHLAGDAGARRRGGAPAGRMAKSSPPRRATTSVARRVWRSRSATAASSRSPAACPSRSLTSAKRSMSRRKRLKGVRRAAATWMRASSCSWSWRSLGSPVRLSWRAWWATAAESARTSDISRITTIRPPGDQPALDVDGEAGPVTPEGGGLDLGGPVRPDGWLGGARPEGGQELLHVAAGQNPRGCPEEAIGGAVRERDLPLPVQDHDGLGHGVGHRLEPGRGIVEAGAPPARRARSRRSCRRARARASRASRSRVPSEARPAYMRFRADTTRPSASVRDGEVTERRRVGSGPPERRRHPGGTPRRASVNRW